MGSSTIAKWVHRHWGDTYYTLSEVAEVIGRSPRTIKRWVASGRVRGASHWTTLSGGQRVWLYNTEDIQRLVKYSRTVRPGRKRAERLPAEIVTEDDLVAARGHNSS